MFLLYQFFTDFPRELEEAAYIDGANKWQIFIKVLLPTSAPILWTLGILQFMGIYNDFVWPLYTTTTSDMRTLTAGIAILTQGAFTSSPAKMMTFSTIATIPILIVFFIGQRSFVKAVTQSGIK